MVLPQLGWDFPPESTWSRGSLANRHRGCLGDSRASQVDNQYSSQSREEVGMRQKKRWADATISDKMKKDSLNSSGQSGQHSALRSWHLSWHLAGRSQSYEESQREPCEDTEQQQQRLWRGDKSDVFKDPALIFSPLSRPLRATLCACTYQWTPLISHTLVPSPFLSLLSYLNNETEISLWHLETSLLFP